MITELLTLVRQLGGQIQRLWDRDYWSFRPGVVTAVNGRTVKVDFAGERSLKIPDYSNPQPGDVVWVALKNSTPMYVSTVLG